MRRGIWGKLWPSIGALAIALAVLPPAAMADAEIGSPGSGAGEIANPRGVAVDPAAGLLYVTDAGNYRVDVFDADSGAFVRAFGWGVLDGTAAAQVCTATCSKGIPGSGAGQFKGMQGIAVDNDPASPAYRSVYVFDGGNNRIQRFDPSGAFVFAVGDGVNQTTGGDICTASSGHTCRAASAGGAAGQINQVHSGGVAVGQGGTIYVADRVGSGGAAESRVQKFNPSGSAAGELLLEVAGGSGGQTGAAVDAAGSIYITTSGGTGALRKYSPAGSELYRRMPSPNVNSVGIGTAGDVLVADNTGKSGLYLFDSAGTQLQTFYGELIWRVVGIAGDGSLPTDLFVAEEGTDDTSGVRRLVPPVPGPVVHAGADSTDASPVGNTKATLNALVNPEGKSTTFHFEYITDEAFQAAGETFGAGTLETPESALPGSFTFAAAEQCRDEYQQSPFTKPDACELRTAQAAVVGLSPETVYHFRVVASNADGSDRVGPTATLETKQPIEFGDLWATGVGTGTATLHAELNPLGIPATARFEYVPLGEFESSGFADAEQAPAPPAGALDLGEGEEMKEVSVDLAGLPDGTSYRYRVVATNRCKPAPAPLCDFAEREGTFRTFASQAPLLGCPNDQQRTEGSGTFLPDCRAYEMVSPADKDGGNIEGGLEPLANLSGFAAGLDQAATSGDAISYSSYRAFGQAASAPFVNQYLARRGSGGWSTEPISPPREGPSLMRYQSVQLDRQYKAFSPDLCSGWVLQDAAPVLAPGAVQGFPGLYRRDNCAEPGTFHALSSPEPPATEPPNLSPEKFIPNFQGSSADGSVSVFTVNDNLTSDAPPQPAACVVGGSSNDPCQSRLYEVRANGAIRFVCILPNGAANPGPCTAGALFRNGGRFDSVANAISADGSRIFWTAASGEPGRLFVRIDGSETLEISSEPARFWAASADGSTALYTVGDRLLEYDVDQQQAHEIAVGVKGLAGAANDGTRAFLASTAVLTGDERNSAGMAAVAGQPNLYMYEVGVGFRFVATLTQEEVSEVVSPFRLSPGERIARVSPSGQQVAFMSVAPITGYDNRDPVTGKPALEVFLYDATAAGGSGRIVCVSCNPSGSRPDGRPMSQYLLEGRLAAARISTHASQLYGSRVIAEGGERVFFNSFESLSARDTNGVEDVYQWRAPGANGCDAQSPSYSPVSGGCVDLISAGTGPHPSEFVDASVDGRDVFIRTGDSLVGQDPGLADIYDARIGGGFSGPPVTSPICEGEVCQAASAPPPALAPSSRVAGPGNPRWRSKKACPKGKHRVMRKGKVRCVPNRKSAKKGKSGNRDGRVRGVAR